MGKKKNNSKIKTACRRYFLIFVVTHFLRRKVGALFTIRIIIIYNNQNKKILRYLDFSGLLFGCTLNLVMFFFVFFFKISIFTFLFETYLIFIFIFLVHIKKWQQMIQ